MLEIKYTVQGEADVEQARGVVAALLAIHGNAVLPPIMQYAQEDHTPRPLSVDMLSTSKPAEATGPAPDGEPVSAPVDAPVTPDDDEGSEEPTGDLDADGIPWDERIHSSSRKQNKDGTWARRRNTDDAVFDAVMAELKAGAQPAEGDTAASAFAPPTPPPPEAPAVPAPPTPLQAPAAPASGDVSFPAIMRTVTEMQRDGKIDKAGVDEILGQMGVASIGLLVTASEDVRAGVAALLEARK